MQQSVSNIERKAIMRKATILAVIIGVVVSLVIVIGGNTLYRNRIANLEQEASKSRAEKNDLQKQNDQLRAGLASKDSSDSLIKDALGGIKSEYDSLGKLAQQLRSATDELNDDITDSDCLHDAESVASLAQEVEKDIQSLGDKIDGLYGKFNSESSQASPFVAPPPKVTQPAPKPKPVEETVYITRTGAKYHRAGCQYLSRSMIPMNKAAAIRSGYDACSRCW